ncbi:MAG: hypothetical protein ACI9QD_000313 [Thermoproteota archaeon]|jgi:hypothetical protein
MKNLIRRSSSFTIIFTILLFLTSCNEASFYEKEALTELFDPTDSSLEVPEGSGSGITLIDAHDSFTQSGSGQSKIDLLWVIDNSGSMKDNQAALAYNFDIFINDFIEKNIDFKMAITTTDARSEHAGVMVLGSDILLTSEKATQNKAKFLNDFKNLIQVGTRGSGHEQGLSGSTSFVDKNQTFLRDDAYFVLVYVSDEADQSSGEAGLYHTALSSVKGNAGLVKAYSIINMNDPATSTQWLTIGHERYKAVSDLSNGFIADIHQDFFQTLSHLGETIANLSESFALSQTPYQGIINVYINDQEVIGTWVYDAQSNAIKFDPNHLPQANDVVKIVYQTQQ